MYKHHKTFLAIYWAELKKKSFLFYSAYNYTIPAKGKTVVETDIQISVPNGCYGRIGIYIYIFFKF